MPERHRRKLGGMMIGKRQQLHIAVFRVKRPVSKVACYLLSRSNQSLRSILWEILYQKPLKSLAQLDQFACGFPSLCVEWFLVREAALYRAG